MTDKNVSVNFSWIWDIVALLCLTALGFIESGTMLGGAIAFVVALLALLSSLLGLIPVIGPLLHVYLIYPAIVATICGLQPSVHLPVTLVVVAVVSTIFSIMLSAIAVIMVLVFVAD